MTTSEDIKVKISKDTQDAFKKMLKNGIYKELYKRNLLSDVQLNSLIRDKK